MEFSFEERLADSPLIDKIWRTRSEYAGTFMSQAVTNWEMVVWKYEGETHISVRGPETRAMLADSPADAEFFGVHFKLGTFMPHLPISELVNGSIILPNSMDGAFWLKGAAWQLPTFDNVDTFVNRLAREGTLVHDPLIESVVLDRPHDLSLRAMQYRFMRATGLTHSTVRQIERAKQAAMLLQQGIPILDTAFETGYFDQAHLTRSLKRYVGQTPAQIARLAAFA